jgi:hypothetical protein
MLPQSVWLNHSMWQCLRHIPKAITSLAVLDKCPMCQYPKPDEAQRPGWDGEVPRQSPILPPGVKPRPPVDPVKDPVVSLESPPPGDLEMTPGTMPLSAPWDPPDIYWKPQMSVAVGSPPVKGTSWIRPKTFKGHLCPGPGCRKISRRDSPYCSKICSDRCYRLRKKATRAALTDREVVYLNRILESLGAWDEESAA